MALLFLAIIIAGWLKGWKWAYLKCHEIGIVAPFDRAIIAAIVPASLLIFSVHVLALVALLSGAGVVSLGACALVFALSVLCCAVQKKGEPASGRNAAVGVRQLANSLQNSPIMALRMPIVIVAATYVLMGIESLTRFPTGYDGLYYHLPTALHWMRTGKLDLVVGDIYHSLPENAMIVPYLLASAGLERAISWFNIPHGATVLGCVYCLARAIGAGTVGAVAATCIAGSVPLVLFQTFSSYVDLYGAAAWMSALLALVWAWRVNDPAARRALFILAGLSAGIALGSKSTYLIHVALLVPVAAWIGYSKFAPDKLRLTDSGAVKHNGDELPQRRWGSGIRAATFFGLAALVCSAFWFLRGAVQAGNPLYPFGITIGSTEILAGFDAGDHVPARSWLRKLTMWASYPWRETNYAGTGYDFGVNNGLGAAYATLVPAAIVFLVIQGWSANKSRGPGSWPRIFLLLTLCAPALVMTAFTEVLRYAFPLLLVGVVLAALLVDRMHAVFPRATRHLLFVALSVTCIMSLLPPARALAGRMRDGNWSRAWQYQVPPIIDGLPAGSRVLYIGPPDLTYPFMGSDFRHEVLHENIWRARYGDGAVDARALQLAGIDYVFLRGEWPDDWDQGPPGELIFDDTHDRALTTTAVTRIHAQ